MSKQNRDSKDFVKLEYSVLDLTEYNGLTINGNMKILLSLVYSYDKTGRTYYESVGTIGKRCGCKPEAVRNFRNKLREAGMITFEEVKGSTHKISPVELDPSLMVFLDDHNSAQASNRKVETEESGKNEQKPVVESFVVASAPPFLLMKAHKADLVYLPFRMRSAICSPVIVVRSRRWDFGLFIGFSVLLKELFAEVLFVTHFVLP